MERNDSTFSCILKVYHQRKRKHVTKRKLHQWTKLKAENISTLKEEKNNRSRTASWEAWWPTCWRNAPSCRMKTRGDNTMMILGNQSVSVKGRKKDYPTMITNRRVQHGRLVQDMCLDPPSSALPSMKDCRVCDRWSKEWQIGSISYV